jgi:hypothetical protein
MQSKRIPIHVPIKMFKNLKLLIKLQKLFRALTGLSLGASDRQNSTPIPPLIAS